MSKSNGKLYIIGKDSRSTTDVGTPGIIPAIIPKGIAHKTIRNSTGKSRHQN